MSTLALVEQTTEKLTALERLEALCDAGSLQLIRSEVRGRRMGDRTSPNDGVIDIEAVWLVRELLDHLPQHAPPPPRRLPVIAPAGAVRSCRARVQAPGLRRARRHPHARRRRAPAGAQPALGAQHAHRLRPPGRPHGRCIVANQPRYLGGVLDAQAATKGARFVRTCDLYGIPLVVLVDTPGFLPGTSQEKLGVIRHGAKLVHAFAAASVPRVTVVLRKAFGGAFIAMNSRELGADLVLAWPQAQLGVMGGPQAVDLVARRAIAAADEPAAERARLAQEYERDSLTADVAAREGVVDEVIEPFQTRVRLAAALWTLDGAERTGSVNRNIPL